MAVTAELGFGIRDVKLTTLGGSPTSADLPRIRSVDVGIVTDVQTLEGDDSTVAVRVFNLHIEGSFEAGGINPSALALMLGVTTVASGVTPAAKVTLSITNTTAPQYFKMEGQVIADDGGDFHFIIYKAKVTSGPQWTFQNGEFVLTSGDYQGVADGTGKVMDFVWNETAVAIT